MDSSISENQFMIHILNNLTSDYELQFAMMERRVGDIEKPLTVEEIRGELSLHYERLNMKSLNNPEGKVLEENAFFSGQLKGSVEVVAKLDTSRSNAKIADLTIEKITVTQMEVFFVRIAVSVVMIRKIVSNSRRRIHESTMPAQITVILTG
jgi:hypothetical protein